MFGLRQLKLFNTSRINEDLLKCSTFIDALYLVETTVFNPHLSVKFSQTCVASLRNEQLYDLAESRRHISEIYSHLVTVLQNINFELDDFEDKWSSFTLGSKKQSSLDTITFDRAVIHGATTIPDDPIDSDARARLIFFFYAKILHEVAHASLAELGRKLPSGDYDARFSSPATHAMTGEAGDAIERHFFGSVTDARGQYTNEEESLYKIEHVVLRERRFKQRVTDVFLRKFIDMNLFTIESMPLADTESLQVPFTPRKRKRHLPSTPMHPTQKLSRTRNSIVGTPTATHQWGWGPEADADSDEEIKPLFDCNGKRHLPSICWKA